MAHVTADRVRDTSTSTGTGTIVVSGTAPTSFRTFSAVLSTNDTFYYAIQHQTASEWEVGLGTYSSANTITRTTVYASSAGGSAVTFSSGTKDVFITLAAARTVQLDNNGAVAGITDAGNLTFTGTGRRIIGDFNNATAANRLAFQNSTTNAQTILTVIPNGTSVASALAIEGDSAVANGANATFNLTSTDVRLGSGGRGTFTYLPMTFYTGGSERMRVDTSGNVGIGTSSPSEKLSVYSAIGVRGSNFASTTYVGSSVNTTGVYTGLDSGGGYVVNVRDAGYQAFSTNNTERMRIDSSGNVGIGTSSPASYGLLSVYGSNVNGTARFSHPGNTSYGTVLTLETYSGTDSPSLSFKNYNGGSPVYYGISTNSSGALQFNSGASISGLGTERMRIDSSGNVGIGTTSPSAKVTAYSGGTNATTYNTMIAAGGGSTATIQNQGTTSVSTTATTILSAGQYGSFCLVFGSDGTNRFMDVVLFGLGTGTVNVISSLAVAGTPSARTYSQSSSTYKLAMASGTYTIQVAAFTMNG